MVNYSAGRIIFFVGIFSLLKNIQTQEIDYEPRLYNSSDHVIVLNVTNLESTILNSDTAYLVEFSSRFCESCKTFAPNWKEFAKDICESNKSVKIAAIDCADKDNTQLCRDYEIMAYPTVRYFSPNDKTIGLDIPGHPTIANIRRELDKQLLKNQEENGRLIIRLSLNQSDGEAVETFNKGGRSRNEKTDRLTDNVFKHSTGPAESAQPQEGNVTVTGFLMMIRPMLEKLPGDLLEDSIFDMTNIIRSNIEKLRQRSRDNY